MGIIRGLSNINKFVEEQEAAHEARKNGESNFRKTVWFGLKDKQAAKVIFLQELDPNSENYSDTNGLGILAVEHSNPADFKRKAVCTIGDEGACYGCEEHKKDYKAGWKQKTRLYINVLVDNGIDAPYIAVLSQGNGPNSVTPSLIEQATELGTITNKQFKIKRNGAGFNDTSYVLTPLAEHGRDLEDLGDGADGEALELFDLDKVVRQIPYASQAEHYNGGEVAVDSAPAEAKKAPLSASSIDAAW